MNSLIYNGEHWYHVPAVKGMKLFSQGMILIAEVIVDEANPNTPLQVVGQNYLFTEKASISKPSQWVNPHHFIADRFGQAKHVVQDAATQGKIWVFKKATR